MRKGITPEKWCAGSCGRLLPREAFARRKDGYWRSMCRGCRRVYERERQGKAYRKNPEPKRAVERAAYWAEGPKKLAHTHRQAVVSYARASAWVRRHASLAEPLQGVQTLPIQKAPTA